MSCRSSSLKMMAIWGQKDTHKPFNQSAPLRTQTCTNCNKVRNDNDPAGLKEGLIDFSGHAKLHKVRHFIWLLFDLELTGICGLMGETVQTQTTVEGVREPSYLVRVGAVSHPGFAN